MKYWIIFRELIIPALLAFMSGLWAYWLNEIRIYGEIRLIEWPEGVTTLEAIRAHFPQRAEFATAYDDEIKIAKEDV